IEIGQIIVGCDAGIVDQDVERADLLHCALNLRNVCHVKHQRRHSLAGMLQCATSTCVNPLCPPSHRLIDECSTDPAVGACDQDRLIRDIHNCSPLLQKSASVCYYGAGVTKDMRSKARAVGVGRGVVHSTQDRGGMESVSSAGEIRFLNRELTKCCDRKAAVNVDSRKHAK